MQNWQTVKKKEKIALIELTDEHGQKHGDLTQGERLRCLDTTSAAFSQLQKHIDQRLQRESCIAEADVEHTVEQIITCPYLGGKKGSLKLQGDEKALIGGTTYQEIRQQLKTLVAKEVLDRHEQSEIEKDQYRREHAKATPFEKISPQKKHEVWAIDFLNFLLFGIYFRICIVYDVFSQAYLAIKPAACATSRLARQALAAACVYSGQTPVRCLLSDNGPQFESYSFEAIKQRLEIESQFIPRGQPWHNGALESGNRDVRKALYTIAFYAACETAGISKTGVDPERIYALVSDCCQEAQVVINETIVRPKFKTTPRAVLNDQVVESQQKRLRFIEQKQRERKQRMAELRVSGGTKRRRLEEKVVAAWKKIAAKKTTNQLFAFRELLHQRYRAITV